MFVVCAEHVEEAIDDFLEAYGEAPDLFLLGELRFSDWTAPAHCDYCSCEPVYLVI